MMLLPNIMMSGSFHLKFANQKKAIKIPVI